MEKTEIPIFIYEEDRGDAFIQTIMLYQNNYDQKMPLFQETLAGRIVIWSKYEKDLKNTIEEIKNQYSRKTDENEFKVLWQEATLAYKAIDAINKVSKSEGQNVENFCRMNYRRQLREYT